MLIIVIFTDNTVNFTHKKKLNQDRSIYSKPKNQRVRDLSKKYIHIF